MNMWSEIFKFLNVQAASEMDFKSISILTQHLWVISLWFSALHMFCTGGTEASEHWNHMAQAIGELGPEIETSIVSSCKVSPR